jgi:hypothetical protein
LSEYLTVSDLKPGEHRAFIREWEARGSKALALYLRGYKKPILVNKKTIDELGRDFRETNWELWLRREIRLSISETEISVKAASKYEPAPKPSNDVAKDLAAVLMRAAAPPHTRADTIAILREAATLLAARQ